MKAFKAKSLLTSALCIGFAASAPSAFADGIETVVVTAEKREQNLQDVPISIDVHSGSELQAFHVDSFAALQNYAPNLLIQSSPGNDAIFIRGFGSQAANYATDQSVSLYLDGIYGGRNRQFMEPFFDVDRIEIMRGPQGALLGKNTAAGALSIITAGPTDTFQSSLTASYNFDRAGVDTFGYVSGPVADDVSARLAFQYTDLGGYIKNTYDNKNVPRVTNFMTRGSVKYQPSQKVDVTVKLEYGDFTTDGTNAVHIDPATGVVATTKDASPALGVPETDHDDAINGSATTNVGIGDHTLRLITGYSHFIDNKYVGGGADPNENWLSTFHEKFTQYSQEAQVLSPVGQRFEYILGAYYDNGTYDQYNASTYSAFLGLPFFNGQIHQVFHQTSNTWSFFASGTFHVSDAFRVLASARYTDDTKKGLFQQFDDFGVPLAPPENIAGNISNGDFDPSGTLQYDVNDDIMLYATYGRGSKAGGFVAQRGATPSTFTFAGERSTNYEIGAKTTWFDRRVLFDIAIFRMPFKNLQVSFYDPTIPGFVTGNAATATSEGFEGQLSWLVAEPLQLDASFAYLNAIYNNFPGAACLAPPLEPPTCNAATNNLAGTTLPGASKWTGNVRATYTTAVGNDLMLALTGIVSFRSTYTTSSDESPIYGTQKSYAKFDARVELSDDADKWGVALVGKNLTNERTINFSYLWPISPPPVGVGFLDETRTISLEGHVRF